jgi:hypothetical protein
MSENKRSFWSSVPGLVTGLAGLLTGIVGLITLLVQLNVIGGDKSKTVATAPTTVVGSPTTVTAGGTTATTVASLNAAFTLSTATLDFPPSDPKEKVVTVKNTGGTPITLLLPKTDGESPTAFVAAFGTCGNGPLASNLSCTIKVTFAPPAGILGRYNATLQVRAQEVRAGAEVKLTGSTIL